MPNRPKDFSTEASAPHSDDFIMVDGATNATRKLAPSKWLAAHRNALAPRGGVAFDGTSGSRILSTLTNQNLLTDSFSVSMLVDIPTSNPTTDRGLFYLSSNAGLNNVPRATTAEFKTSGQIAFFISGATTSDTRGKTYLNFRSDFSGKRVHLLFVRDAATPTGALYVNGVLRASSSDDITGSDPTWAGSVTSTYFVLGNNASSAQVWDRCIYSASLYNLALTQADVTEIYELGGAVPERFKFGSQANLFSGDTANFAGGTAGAWVAVAGGSIAIVANKLQYTHPSGAAYGIQAPFALAGGKAFRIKFTHRLVSGVAMVGGVGLTGSGTPGVPTWTSTGTTAQFDNVGIMSANPDGALYMLAAGLGTGEVYEFDDFSVTRVGAVCHLRLSDGIGRVLRDSSTNKLHALRTVAGVSDVIELDDGVYPQLALTANGELLDTAGVLRTDAVLVDVVVKNTTANAVTAFGLGMSSGVRNLTYETNIPANSTVILPINRADLAGLTVGTAPYGRVYYSAASWNSGSLNLSIRYRRERDL